MVISLFFLFLYFNRLDYLLVFHSFVEAIITPVLLFFDPSSFWNLHTVIFA